MRYLLFCGLLIFSSYGWSQPTRWRWQIDVLVGQIARLERDTALQQKDSLYHVYLALQEKLKQTQADAETYYWVSQKMSTEARLIEGMIERNEVTSVARKDSLIDVANHLYSRAGSIDDYMRFFPDKRDTFNTLMAEIDKTQPGPDLDRAMAALMEMVLDTNSYPLIIDGGLYKLGTSHHPLAFTFLMDNLMNFAIDYDPTSYGQLPSFYVWPGNYPCYEYLREPNNPSYNEDGHLLPYFLNVLYKQIIPEKYISLYANLLYNITGYQQAYRDALLLCYLIEPDWRKGVENKRANIAQIIKYYTDPVDYYKDLEKSQKPKD